MTDQSEIARFVQDWWHFAFFVGGAVIAFVAGKERQRYKVDEIGRDVAGLKESLRDVQKELSSMKEQEGLEALSAAKSITELATDIKYLRKTMDELRDELRGKADK